jgi:hypothetical protein
MYKFFESILGIQGLIVMKSLTKSSPDLEAYITPRVVVSWLRQSGYGQIHLPNVCPLQTLEKTGYGFNGKAVVMDLNYSFTNATEEQIAAIISVATETNVQNVDLKDVNLARLAKTIDALVKAQIKQQYEHTEVAKPLEPLTPQKPTQPNNDQIEPAKTSDPRIKIPKIPKVKKKTLVINKSETNKSCELCKQKLFTNHQFVGCSCFKTLAKNIDTTINNNSITLSFSEELDPDAILTIINVVKND